MSTLLEITGNDIAALKDDDLRTLIGLLCEADYRTDGLPTKGIIWGGHQDAKDDGVDVAVHNTVPPPARSYVPRSNAGFQVKKPDMPKARIQEEMRPKDVLRSSIKALIKNKGAYVIVSSSGSVTDAALSKRKDAMREAVKGEDNHEDLHLDFLDRGRVATWVRSYPSLVAWVRGKIGNPIKGWRPYGNWGNTLVELEEEYLLDDGLRLRDLENPSDKGQSVADGLEKIRAILADPGTSVRLIGLSGVGKTRFVQALFDSRIGEHALNSSQAIYTDMSDDPEPSPVTLANQLINDKSRAVFIVDNCPPDLHRLLTQACSSTHSTTSVITVEYDVQEDISEEPTCIFQLEPASIKLIEKLVANRFPNIGQVDAGTIAEFSGGNARVAIVLANTVHCGETLSGFRSKKLFKRLFWQHHAPNESLLVSAQACALVYSFRGEDATSEASELRFLGLLVGKTGEELYRDVAALKNRDLVQSRGVWRAVLPHAIANRLAKQALETIPKETLVNDFPTKFPEHLIKSFTRRLSYLHDSETAVAIVKAWLEPRGWIGESIHNLNSFSADVLKNIAPVSPEATLLAIERAANESEGATFAFRENTHYEVIVQLLRHLAYDHKLFKRSVNLIVRFALTENQNILHASPLEVLKSLFYLYLSGTHASVKARATVIQNLLDSEEVAKHELGLLLLDATLEAWRFTSSQKFEFGARPRNYGYDPKTRKDITHWFDSFIQTCTKLALSNHPLAKRARKLLADKLRGLWTKGGMFATIERTTERLLKQGAWNEGWIVVQDIIRYDSKDFDENTRERLLSLEKRLKPQDLLEKARTFALSEQHRSFDPEGNLNEDEPASARYERMNEATRKVGAEVAKDPDVFRELLPELVSTSNSRLYNFGQGLAEGCADKVELFGTLRSAFEKTPLPHDQGQINVILGFLSHSARTDPAFYNAAMDGLVDDKVMAEWFLILQTKTASTIDQREIERFHKALDLGKAPIRTAWWLGSESIDDENLASLLEKVLTKDGGIGVVVEILQIRFDGNNAESLENAKALIDTARKTLMMHPFSQRRHQHENEDYALANIAARSLGGSYGAATAKVLAKNLANAIFTDRTYASDYIRLLNKLAEIQPKIFLDKFLGREDAKQAQLERLFLRVLVRGKNPMSKIPDDMIIAWCEEDPSSRYENATYVIDAFGKSRKTGKYEWRLIVNTILSKAPEPGRIVEQLGWMLRPSTWSGSLADILEERSVLLADLCEHEDAKIASYAKRYYSRLKKRIASEREREREDDRNRYETFE